MRNFRELEIWQNSMHIALDIYAITSDFPDREKYGLSSQLQRASVSMVSNIAEGAARNSEKEFARFLEMAIGSSFEVETQLILSRDLGYLDNDRYDRILDDLHTTQRKINKLISKINGR